MSGVFRVSTIRSVTSLKQKNETDENNEIYERLLRIESFQSGDADNFQQRVMSKIADNAKFKTRGFEIVGDLRAVFRSNL